MRRTVAILVLIVCAFAVSVFVVRAEEPSSWSLLPLPVAFYSPDTGIGGGLGLMVFHDAEALEENSFAQFIGMYTQKRQIRIGFGADWKTGADGEAVVGSVAYQEYPSTFFGLGPDSDLDDEEIYTPRGLDFALGYRFPLWRRLSLTPQVQVIAYEIVDSDPGGLVDRDAVRGSDGTVAVGPTVELQWDGRDDAFYPREGLYASARFGGYPAFLGTSDPYANVVLDLRQFLALGGDHVLAWQLLSESAGGDVPFAQLPALGGPFTMRGYLDGRYRDHLALTAQGEYRFPIVWRFRGAVFAAVGNVGGDAAELLQPADLKPAAGGGIRFKLLKDQEVSMRFDVAVSLEGVQVYFSFNEAF